MMRQTATVGLSLRMPVEVRNGVVVQELMSDGVPAGDSWECVDGDGTVFPAQVTQTSSGSSLLGVYVEVLEAGAELSLALRPAQRADASRGIEVRNQPENGRLLVNYSGFSQTTITTAARTSSPGSIR